MFLSHEPLYLVKISSNNGAVIVYFDLSKNSIHKKQLPKTKFKQLLNKYLIFFW
jgi:hydroxymethylpyrimidine pyrophosphatase-like HAD family hydrolase